MQLTINTASGNLLVTRFSKKSLSLKAEYPLTVVNKDIVTVGKQGVTTWEDSYNDCIENAEDKINKVLSINSKHWLWSINNISSNTKEFTILPGRLFCLNKLNPHTLTLSKPYLNSILSISDQFKIMHKFVMCIFHYLSNLYRRLMNTEKPYGIVQRYLGAQACWNLNMFNINFIANTFATSDSINIVLGYINKSCDLVDVNFAVNITADGDGLGLLGIYLDSASANYDPTSHTILRNFITTDGTDYGMSDITNPNDCKWQFGGTWSKAVISQEFSKVEKQVKCTYIITRNPYVLGDLRYNKNKRCTFHVTIKATAQFENSSNIDSREYQFDVQCATLERGYSTEYPTNQE